MWGVYIHGILGGPLAAAFSQLGSRGYHKQLIVNRSDPRGVSRSTTLIWWTCAWKMMLHVNQTLDPPWESQFINSWWNGYHTTCLIVPIWPYWRGLSYEPIFPAIPGYLITPISSINPLLAGVWLSYSRHAVETSYGLCCVHLNKVGALIVVLPLHTDPLFLTHD